MIIPFENDPCVCGDISLISAIQALVMWAICKKEISSYFHSLVGYLLIGVFLVLTALLLWVFPQTSIFNQPHASLRVFFEFAPILYMVMVPAITMRSIASEKTSGTWEWLLSKPISVSAIVWGKFFAALFVCMLSLVPTLVFVYVLNELAYPAGSLDLGAIFAAYLGLFFILSGFVALGMLCSALTTHPIAAFLVGILLNFAFFYGFSALNLPSWTLAFQLESISRGVIYLRDLSLLLALVFIGIFGAIFYLEASGGAGGTARGFAKHSFTLVLIAVLLAAGFLIPFRFDFTKDKRFTLSEFTESTLVELADDLEIQLFLEGDLPPEYDLLRQSVVDLLRDFQKHASIGMRIYQVNPLAHDDPGMVEELRRKGAHAIQINVSQSEYQQSQQIIIPSALIKSAGREMMVNFLPQGTPQQSADLSRAIANLEYTFVSSLRKLTQQRRPVVGFTEGQGELDQKALQGAIQSLVDHFHVGFIDLEAINQEGLEQIDVLIVAKPSQAFSSDAKIKLDYFLMKGGRLVLALDQLNGELDSLRSGGSQQLLSRELNLDDLLFSYGLRFNHNVLVDMNCGQIPVATSASSSAGIELAPWPLHPILIPQSAHAVMKELGGIQTRYLGSIDTIQTPGVRSEFVLFTSPYVRVLEPLSSVSLGWLQNLPSPEEMLSQPIPVAALLEGRFPSGFKYRSPQGHPESSEETKIFAIADGDIFANAIHRADGSSYPLGWDPYQNIHYANNTLLLNLMDYMTDDEALIGLRNKEVSFQPLDPAKIRGRENFWILVNLGIPLSLLLLLGFTQHFLRKRKYQKGM